MPPKQGWSGTIHSATASIANRYVSMAEDVMSRPGPAAHQRAVEALLARLATVGRAGEVEGLMWDLLGISFDHDTFDMLLPRPRWEELSRLQQRVLRVVADTDRLLQGDPDDPWARDDPPPAWNPLAAYGLPDTRAQLQAYVRLQG